MFEWLKDNMESAAEFKSLVEYIIPDDPLDHESQRHNPPPDRKHAVLADTMQHFLAPSVLSRQNDKKNAVLAKAASKEILKKKKIQDQIDSDEVLAYKLMLEGEEDVSQQRPQVKPEVLVASPVNATKEHKAEAIKYCNTEKREERKSPIASSSVPKVAVDRTNEVCAPVVITEKNPIRFTICPTQGCNFKLAYDKSNFRLHCESCDQTYCLNCKVEDHSGKTCEQYRREVIAKDATAKFEPFIAGADYRQCDGCEKWIRKSDVSLLW